MIEIIQRILVVLERVRNMEELSVISTGVFSVLLIFGILNCLLGYRLLRFWMMLGGFSVGAGAGFFIAGAMEITDRAAYLGIMAAAGLILGAVAFFIYKIGVFVLGAGIGVSLSVYILHPTTSFIFFLCLLIGAGLGTLAVRYSREILIVSTSLMGGAMAGFSLAKLGQLDELPYGILMSAGCAALGILVQFATNRAPEKEDRDEEKDGLEEIGQGLEDYADSYVDELDREDTQRYDIRRKDRTVPDKSRKKRQV